VEPAAAALQTFEMAGDPKGLTVVVLGPGRLGTLIVAAAADAGARVAAVARSEASRQRALRFGAEAVFGPEDDEALRAWTGALGADVVVEATGVASSIDRALDIVRPRGTIAVKSTPGTPPVVDLTRLVVDEVRINGSRCGDFSEALRWLASSTWPVEELVSATFPLEKTEEALQAAFALSKVVICP
jgi:alcohol dehydrogenase